MRVQGVTSVAANGTSGNVLAGKVLEITQRPSVVKVFAVAAAASSIKGTFFSGSDIVMEESDISGANRFPISPDDMTCQDVAGPLDRLNLSFRNTTAGAVVVNWFVDVTPIA